MSHLDENRLEKVRERAGKIICRCPACFEEGHDKTGNHLSVWPNGKYACVQFPGDEGKEHRKRIFALVGIRDQTAPRTFPTLSDAIGSVTAKGKRLVKIARRDWYHDRNGKKLFLVVRFDGNEGKEFRPFHQTPDGWVVADPSGKLPLFNLPELLRPDIEFSSEPVFVPEGEKCVCELRDKLGLLATTSAHGAKAPHKTNWEPLAGRPVVFLPDNDKEGQGYARTSAQILMQLSPRATCKIVELPRLPEKGDCVDWIAARDGKPPEQIKAELLELTKNAEVIRPAVVSESQARRSPLSIRTVDEILSMTFNDTDLILKNGYLSRGEHCAVCGMGGIGKSRLSMQIACCCRAGRDFLTWPTDGRDLRWLFLQTENSCRRLKADLEKMLSAFRPEEQEHIKAGLFFHTLENDEDGFLMLDAENLERVAAAITRTEAGVVVYDPLRDFSLEDLNSDKFMGDTLREIARVTKRGNPQRTPLVIHHAATGKAGVQRTTGFDRSSFGRNSKVLFAWTRAQINVAPAKGEDNSLIIVASGKCNDAPEFEAFAARLNFETMLYERDQDFDVDQWHQQISPTQARPTYSPEIVRDLIWPTDENKAPKHLVKKKLAMLVQDASGCGRTKAYELIDAAQKKGYVRFSKLSQSYEKLDTEQATASRGLYGSVRRPSAKNPRG